MSKLQPDSKPSGKPFKHVMLVEDDAILAIALEEAFVSAGTKKVTVCQSVKATMQALGEGDKADLIVLDVHLADRDDGWAVAELVTLLGSKPPKIAFSTGSPEDIPSKIAAMGRVFAKPYAPDALVLELMAERRSKALGLLRR